MSLSIAIGLPAMQLAEPRAGRLQSVDHDDVDVFGL